MRLKKKARCLYIDYKIGHCFSHRTKKTDTGNGMKGKNTRPNNAQRYERKFPIGYKELLQLSREDPNVIQFRIACQSSSFPKLLSTVNGKPGTVVILNTKNNEFKCRRLTTLACITKAWPLPGQRARHTSTVGKVKIAFLRRSYYYYFIHM